MVEAKYRTGERFHIHFVWQLPDDGDFVRAVFDAEVLGLDARSDKYLVKLVSFVAGRQESAQGVPREQSQLAHDYWRLVLQKLGRKVEVAFEADDERPLRLRLSTLTEEHKFFRRFEDEST